MLPLPNPYPNELFYSVVARHVARWPELSVPKLLDGMGVSGRLPFAFLPPRENVSALFGTQLFPRDQLGRFHTLDILFKIVGRSSLVRMAGGFAASSIFRNQKKMFCTQCLTEDDRIGRERYWRRFHQVPGIRYCSIHYSRLLASHFDVICSDRRKFDLAEKAVIGSVEMQDRASPVQERLASQLLLMLDGAAEPFFYRESLYALGYSKDAFHINPLALHKDIHSFFGDKFLSELGVDCRVEDANSWIRKFYRRSNGRFLHPTLHVMMRAFIGANGCGQPVGSSALTRCGIRVPHAVDGRVTLNWFRTARGRGVRVVCSCGSIYTSHRSFNGKWEVARVLKLGSIVIARAAKERAAGRSERGMAAALGIPRNALLRFCR